MYRGFGAFRHWSNEAGKILDQSRQVERQGLTVRERDGMEKTSSCRGGDTDELDGQIGDKRAKEIIRVSCYHAAVLQQVAV